MMVAVALHAAFAPAASRAVLVACQSEEETEHREHPAEEELSEVMGTAPPRGVGVGTARPLYLLVGNRPSSSRGQAALPRNSQSAELAARNGVGAPLRC